MNVVNWFEQIINNKNNNKSKKKYLKIHEVFQLHESDNFYN